MRELVLIPLILVGACRESTQPEPKPERLTIMPESIALAIGEQVLVQAATVPVTPTIAFEIKDTSIATIDDRGIVTARNFGVTFVVARAASLRDSGIVAVPRPTVALNPDAVTIRIGEQALVLHSHAHGTTPQVISRNPAVAHVAIDPAMPKHGRWITTGVAAGTTYIVASSSNGPLTVLDSTRVTVLP